jgi:hypothetical protein
MSLSNLMGILQQYANRAGAAPAETENDFEKVSQSAPQDHVADGLSAAFRSDQTPPFAQMLSTLFEKSDPQQRAGILTHLLSAAGPAVAGSGILGSLAGALTGGGQVTPQQASQVPPEAVHDLAQKAQESNPSIIEQASSFYAQHPTLVKALGAGSLALIMSQMSQRGR